jgi:hypothetical protein
MRRLALLLALAVLVLAVPLRAADCPSEDGHLLFHSCHGPAKAELLLLPEEAGTVEVPRTGRTLVIGGGYTGADQRDGGLPNPVGLFVDQGRVISPHLARMDGILVIGPKGELRIHHATRVPHDGGTADLTDSVQRLDFAARAAEQGLSVMQSHLLIANGRIDVREQDDAPTARRRMLFSGPDGWGVYQTSGASTLFDAAGDLMRRFRPEMAMNLDMGSYDYCVESRGGVVANCGVLGVGDTAKLSNLLRFSRPDS